MGRGTLLVGVGDSSFSQLPCGPSATLSHQDDENARVEQRISRVSCGATAAIALSSPTTDTEKDDTPLILEWGTGLYGERLSQKEFQPDESGTVLRVPTATSLSLSNPLLARIAIRLIASGAHFVVAAVGTGGCVSWGGGRDTRSLGRGSSGSSPLSPCTSTSAITPRPFSSMPDWVAEPLGPRGLQVTDLASGDDHTVAVCADGSSWAWGRGNCGQLGSGPPGVDRASNASYGRCSPTMIRLTPCPTGPSAASSSGSVTLGEGTRGADGRRSAVVRAASCGRDHSAILTKDGRIWTFGSGLYGQVGRRG